jgi:adenylate cyclase
MINLGAANAEAKLFHDFERETKGILFLDVVESVRLIDKDEEGVISRWLLLVKKIKSEIVPNFSGQIIKLLGDGMLVVFVDGRSTAMAALAIQRLNNRLNSHYSDKNKLQLRFGLELSDIIVEEDDIYGRGVNLAARLMSLAGPNEIVASVRIRDQLASGLDAEIEDLGECFLRHVEAPVRAYRIGPANKFHFSSSLQEESSLAPTIAVIPFTSRNTDFAGKMNGEIFAEEIICQLSRTEDLKVISRLSTTAFVNRDMKYDKIGMLLNADYLMTGVIYSEGEDAQVDIELSEAKTGNVIWADRITGSPDIIFSGQDETISRIVSQTEVEIMSRELTRAKKSFLPSLKSYTLLMAAIKLMHRLSVRDFEKARYYLQTLIDRDTGQSIPLAWLANWHVLRVQQGWSPDPTMDCYLALDCTKHALESDPECSLALTIDGFVQTNLAKRFDLAKNSYDLALSINPNNGLAWLLKGTLHAFMDEGDEAVSDTRRAMSISPFDPHIYFYESLSASAYLTAANYEKALEFGQRSYRHNRTHASTLRVMAVAHWQLGQKTKAKATINELMNIEPDFTISKYLSRTPSADFEIGKLVAKTLHAAGVPD